MKYEDMLKRLYKKIPNQNLSNKRFELPDVNSNIEGNKTIVYNFDKILKAIRRPKNDFLKYITKELATAASVSENKLMLKGRFAEPQLKKVVESYTKRYVLCKECKRPDTKVVEHKGVKMLKCEACGALSPIA